MSVYFPGRRILLLSAVATILVMGGCDNSFSPKAPYKPQLVVFAVLDAASTVQFVRVETTYDAEVGATRPIEDHSVAQAVVRISGSGPTYTLRDTLVPTPEGGTRRVWVVYGFQPKPDARYRLDVSVPGFDPVYSELTVPSHLYAMPVYVDADTGVDLVRIRPGVDEFRTLPGGYYYRLFVTMLKTIEGVRTEVRAEVPVVQYGSDQFVYSSPGSVRTIAYPVPMIMATHARLQAGDSTATDSKLLVTAYAMDRNFYGYYKVSRGFDDPVSMRLDAPDISFINGGLGVFGAMMIDSTRTHYFSFLGIRQ